MIFFTFIKNFDLKTLKFQISTIWAPILVSKVSGGNPHENLRLLLRVGKVRKTFDINTFFGLQKPKKIENNS